MPSHGHRLHMPYQGCEGTPDWVDVLALGRKRRLRSSRFVLVIRWTAAGRRGAGGGWVAATVVAARVGRSRGAVVQFIDKVVFVLLQLKFQHSRVCTGSSSTECWTFRLCSERGTHSANCAEGCSCVDVPVISSDKFPQSRGSNPLAPDSAHPQSGEHSCCATDFRRDSTGAVLGFLGSCSNARICATTGAQLLAEFPYFQRECGLRS